MTNKVLIVEDSPLLRSILRSAIKEAGYTVYEAENGRNGLSSVKETRPDIVILDVLMPVMDGMAMYDELREQDWGKEVPVIMLTSSKDKEVEHWINERELDSIEKDDRMVDEVLAKISACLKVF